MVRLLGKQFFFSTLGLCFAAGAVFSTALAQEATEAPQAMDHGSMSMDTAAIPADPRTILRFNAQVDGRPAACGVTYRNVGAGETTVNLMDYRFYVSNVRLITDAGEEVPLELEQDGLWQYDTVALLDFEDGTGACAESGNPELNSRVIGTLLEANMGATYTGVAFEMGVPEELNHLDTTAAPAPLNIPAMWWNWQYGYKFARLDLATMETELPAWLVHLGSTGCAGDVGSQPPPEPCAQSNRVSVRLDGFNTAENFIVADVGALMTGVNLNENVPMPNGCMSGEDPDCVPLFPNFGLDLESGNMLPDAAQTFFRVE